MEIKKTYIVNWDKSQLCKVYLCKRNVGFINEETIYIREYDNGKMTLLEYIDKEEFEKQVYN